MLTRADILGQSKENCFCMKIIDLAAKALKKAQNGCNFWQKN
jgi:hypothetical protein